MSAAEGSALMWRRLWLRFLAFSRLSDAAVCEMSIGRGLANDYHDYPDIAEKYPAHFETLQCCRCGKEFVI